MYEVVNGREGVRGCVRRVPEVAHKAHGEREMDAEVDRGAFARGPQDDSF